MPRYHVEINGSETTGASGASFDVKPDPQLIYEVGEINAQKLANYYGGEFCDSGTIKVTGNGERALIARH